MIEVVSSWDIGAADLEMKIYPKDRMATNWRMVCINNQINSRYVSATDSSISFANAKYYAGYASSITDDNSRVIPLRIWGIK